MDQNKIILYLLTFLIDICLLYCLLNIGLSIKDRIFCLFTLFCHILFYISLSIENTELLRVLHFFVFFLITLSCFLDNIYLVIICLFLLITIQLLWVFKKRCILNDYDMDNNFGYGKQLEVFCIILTILLVYRLVLNHKYQ